MNNMGNLIGQEGISLGKEYLCECEEYKECGQCLHLITDDKL